MGLMSWLPSPVTKERTIERAIGALGQFRKSAAEGDARDLGSHFTRRAADV